MTHESAHTSRLAAEAISLAYSGRSVLEDLDLSVPDGCITAVVGANGCGKSTLLRGLGRLLRPTDGRIVLDGRDIQQRSTRDVAKMIGLLPQAPVSPDGITVTELVGRGRHPHRGMFRPWSGADDAAVAEAMRLTSTLDLAERRVDELSGGQRQRVWIAMVLAQQTDLLLLDEPTSFLDIAHAVEVLDLITDLNRQAGTTVVMVLHDLNLAARYADHLVAMASGGVLASGVPQQVVTPQVVGDAFGIRCQVLPDPVSHSPLVVPIGRYHDAEHPPSLSAVAT